MFLEDEEIYDGGIPQREKEIEIPDFLKRNTDRSELPTEEQLMAQAMLNNIPNNTDIEKQNHLAELERACQNWDDEEWARVIIHANSHLMFSELDRRSEEHENSIYGIMSNLERLKSQKIL